MVYNQFLLHKQKKKLIASNYVQFSDLNKYTKHGNLIINYILPHFGLHFNSYISNVPNLPLK